MTAGITLIGTWAISYVVLELVTDAPPTPIRYPCLLCRQPKPIQASTRQSIADLRHAMRFCLVLCKNCWLLFATLLNPISRGHFLIGGNKEIRELAGIGQ